MVEMVFKKNSYFCEKAFKIIYTEFVSEKMTIKLNFQSQKLKYNFIGLNYTTSYP